MHCGWREFKTEYFIKKWVVVVRNSKLNTLSRHTLWLQAIQNWILYQYMCCGCKEALWLQGIQNWILYQDMYCGCKEFKTEYFINTSIVAARNSKLNTLSILWLPSECWLRMIYFWTKFTLFVPNSWFSIQNSIPCRNKSPMAAGRKLCQLVDRELWTE